MPMNKKDYPPNWPELGRLIRERAGNKCEWCFAPNHDFICRWDKPQEYQMIVVNGSEKWVPILDFDWWFGNVSITKPDLPTLTNLKNNGYVRVVLTVAHLDRNRHNNDLGNLAALCQRCHLNHDREAQHIPSRRYGRHHDRGHQLKIL